MKKLLKLTFLAFTFGIAYLISPKTVYADVLYSQDFRTSFEGYTTSFGSCSPSENGLTCSPAASSIYNTPFPTSKCITGDYLRTRFFGHGSDLIFSETNNNLGNLVLIKFKLGNNIILSHTNNGQLANVWDTGIQTPQGVHSYALCRNGADYTVYLDEDEIFSQEIVDFEGSFVGFQLDPGDTLSSFTVLDNNPFIAKHVPMHKQTDPVWGGDVYDSAAKWSSDPTMARWGCAVTSAAMILKYFGYEKLPDGTLLDPGSLNDWLKSQVDGYVGNGFTNWLAISRLSKQAASINGIIDFEALEYTRYSSFNPSLFNELPGILEEPGHFFVGKEFDNNSILINDPFYNRDSVPETHNILSFGKYTPSNTDLSYLLFTYPSDINLIVYDGSNEQVGWEYLQTPIQDPNTSNTLGQGENVYIVPKPEDGEYVFDFRSENAQMSAFVGYAYDSEGGVEHIVLPKSLVSDSSIVFNLEYTKDSGDTTDVVKEVSFVSILQGLKMAYGEGLIHNGPYNSISAQVRNAEKAFDRGKMSQAKKKVQNAHRLASKFADHLISDEYRESLLSDLTLLQAQI